MLDIVRSSLPTIRQRNSLPEEAEGLTHRFCFCIPSSEACYHCPCSEISPSSTSEGEASALRGQAAMSEHDSPKFTFDRRISYVFTPRQQDLQCSAAHPAKEERKFLVSSPATRKGKKLTEKNIYKIYDLTISAPESVVSQKARQELESGTYELSEIRGIRETLDRDAPVVELGAGIGVVSCFVNRFIADPTKHIAIEPHPGAYGVLKRNRALNDCYFEPVLAALIYDENQTHVPDQSPTEWCLSSRLPFQGWATPTTLSKIVNETGWSTFNLVADIEGMELELLHQELDLVRARALTINIEIHPYVYGSRKAAEIMQLLQENGFALEALLNDCVFGFRRTNEVREQSRFRRH